MSSQKKYGSTDSKFIVQLYVLTANDKHITKSYIRTNILKGTYRILNFLQQSTKFSLDIDIVYRNKTYNKCLIITHCNKNTTKSSIKELVCQ